MWNYVDKKLTQFNNKFNKYTLTMMDEIQNVFDKTKDLDKYATRIEIKRFKRQISNNYMYLSSYGKYQANRYLNKRRMTNNDILWFSLFMLYAYRQYLLNGLEYDLFKNISEDIYNTESSKLNKLFKRPTKGLNINKLVDKYLNQNNSKGYIWQEYNDAMIEYNTNELYKQVLYNIKANKPLDINNLEFQKIISKQNKRLISINNNKTSGALDNETIYLGNEIKKETYLFYGVTKCKFIAVEDKVTTKMCKSLNNQIFNVHDWNEFERYSAIRQQKVKYKVYGLIPGVNLPPIDDHYHYCRSTITYQVEDERN